jgi:hypothetical protein
MQTPQGFKMLVAFGLNKEYQALIQILLYQTHQQTFIKNFVPLCDKL